MLYLSPLRYPGGKAKMADFFARIIQAQPSPATVYAEPFAGGAGAALRLLEDGAVKRIILNDKNPGIFEFWRNVYHRTDQFVDDIRRTMPSVDEWHVHREIYMSPEAADPYELGFATFFLNRCNHSGILSARPIGGLEQQGNWKIDARFNPEYLAKRIEYVAQKRDQVQLHNLDALDFMTILESEVDTVFTYVDPPYIQQGEELYMQQFGDEQHQSLSERLADTDLQWVLTYDAHKSIPDDLYKGRRCAAFGIAHTARKQHIGREYIVFSDGLEIPDLQVLPNRAAEFLGA